MTALVCQKYSFEWLIYVSFFLIFYFCITLYCISFAYYRCVANGYNYLCSYNKQNFKTVLKEHVFN